MEALAGRAWLLLVLALTSACGAPGTAGTPTRDTAEPMTTGPKATGSPDAPAPALTAGPATTIPDGVRLRHEDEWRALERPGRSPLQDVCIDPGQGGLYLPATTDHRAVSSGTDTEELGLYRGPGRAGDAIALWRVQAERCGGSGSNDHVGKPMEWVVRRVEVAGSDEAWQAHLLMTREGPDLGVLASFLTVIRVGNAVYVQQDGDPASPAAVVEKGDTGIASVTAYVPMLAVFAQTG